MPLYVKDDWIGTFILEDRINEYMNKKILCQESKKYSFFIILTSIDFFFNIKRIV